MSDAAQRSLPAGLPQVGSTIAGKYEVDAVLGVGGMGAVVRARHLRLQEHVAIKLLLPELAENTEVVQRFVQEARAAARIRSERVARVFDVETLENGLPYMVMEYLEGRDLKAVLEERGPLPAAEVATYVSQACEGVAAAHGLGIVHRDLKPSNLYLTHQSDGTPCVKVLDFGIAKLTIGDQDRATTTNTQMGTPVYMAPEQLRSTRDVDARADVWALGVVLYELLTGALPFQGDSLAQIAVAVVLNTPPAVRELNPEVPAELDAVVQRCLHKEREQRTPSAKVLADELGRVFGWSRRDASAATLAGAAPNVAGNSAGAVSHPTLAHEATPPPVVGVAPATPSAPRRAGTLIGGAVVAVLVLGGVVWRVAARGAAGPDDIVAAGGSLSRSSASPASATLGSASGPGRLEPLPQAVPDGVASASPATTFRIPPISSSKPSPPPPRPRRDLPQIH